MTNAPGSRTTHVVRILGTNRAGDVVDGIWIDVERIDELVIRTQTTNPSNQWQEISIRPKWRDDPAIDGYEPEDSEDTLSSRNHKILKICDPGSGDFEDPEEWVPVKVIKHVDFADSGKQRQKRFATDREVTTRRVHHYDTSIDDAAQEAFAAGQKAFVIDGPSYFRDDDSKDDSQYIEHEVIWSYDRTDSRYHQSNGRDQDVQVRLNNQYLIDESAEALLEEIGPEGVNPPYRLDPFQNIINVQLGGATEIPAGNRQYGTSTAGSSQKVTIAIWYNVGKLTDLMLGDRHILFQLGKDSIPPGDTDIPGRPELTFFAVGKPFDYDHAVLYVQFGGVKNSATVPFDEEPIPATPYSDYNHIGTTVGGTVEFVDGWNFISASIDTTDLIGTGFLYPRVSGTINTNPYAHPSGSIDDQIADAYPFAIAQAPGTGEWFQGDPGSSVPYPVDLNGPLGFPSDPSYFDGVGTDRLMSVRIWNKYIDFDNPVNVEKFVVENTGVDADKNPFLMVPSSVANDAFGDPVLWFEGPPGSFKNERISETEYTQTVAKDFKSIPAPKKAPTP